MLMAACEIKNTTPELVQLILRFKPHINLQDSVGRTALHLACRAGKANIVKMLAEVERIDVNRRTCGGETPLMYAAQSGDIFTVGECLNHNFNPFLQNSLHMTAKDYAVYFPNVYGHSLQSVFDTAIE